MAKWLKRGLLVLVVMAFYNNNVIASLQNRIDLLGSDEALSPRKNLSGEELYRRNSLEMLTDNSKGIGEVNSNVGILRSTIETLTDKIDFLSWYIKNADKRLFKNEQKTQYGVLMCFIALGLYIIWRQVFEKPKLKKEIDNKTNSLAKALEFYVPKTNNAHNDIGIKAQPKASEKGKWLGISSLDSSSKTPPKAPRSTNNPLFSYENYYIWLVLLPILFAFGGFLIKKRRKNRK